MGNFGFTFIDARASAFKSREEVADEDGDGDGEDEDEDEDDRVVVICPPKVVTACCTAASAASAAALFCHVAYYESYVLCKIAYIVCSVVCHLSCACTFLWHCRGRGSEVGERGSSY